MFFRSGFNYDVDAASLESGQDCGPEPSMTQQSFAAEVDINTIVKRFGLTGEMPETLRIPLSGDFEAEVTDFHSAMNMLRRTEEEFMSLPGDVRARFQHDAGKLIAFLEDDRNREEAVRLGLVKDVPRETVDPKVE